MKGNLKDLWLHGKGMMILGLLGSFVLGPVTQAQS